MNKQIEEMAKVIKSSLDGLGSGNFNFTGDEISLMFAEAIYTAGYRKASDGFALLCEKDKRIGELELTLQGVMWFVDKWLDGAELEQDEVNRAITMREKKPCELLKKRMRRLRG